MVFSFRSQHRLRPVAALAWLLAAASSALAVTNVPNVDMTFSTGAITLTFDPTLPGGGPRTYAALLSLASNDSAQPVRQILLQVTAYAAAPGLVSHFTFDDPAQPGRDLGPFANHGTLRGNAAHSADARIGTGSLALDGNGDLVDLGVSSGPDYTSSLVGDGDGFTLACWAFIPSDAPTGFTRFSMTSSSKPASLGQVPARSRMRA
jgi:hypothetical protein